MCIRDLRETGIPSDGMERSRGNFFGGRKERITYETTERNLSVDGQTTMEAVSESGEFLSTSAFASSSVSANYTCLEEVIILLLLPLPPPASTFISATLDGRLVGLAVTHRAIEPLSPFAGKKTFMRSEK